MRSESIPGRTVDAKSSSDEAVLGALIAGLVWGIAEALRVGTGLAISVATATGVAGALLFMWQGIASVPWLLPTARAVVCGAMIAAGPLSVLGQVLAANTHHRPLGAATFAVLAGTLCVATTAPVLQLFQLTAEASAGQLVRLLMWGVGAVSLVFSLWRASDVQLPIAVAVAVAVVSLGAASQCVRKFLLVERARRFRAASWFAFGALSLAAIWLTTGPGGEHRASIPIGFLALFVQN